MADFALVIHKKSEEQYREKNLFKKIAHWLRANFKKPDLQEYIRMIALYDNVRLFLFSLPYTGEELLRLGQGRRDELGRFIAKVCADNQIRHSLFCGDLQTLFAPGETGSPFQGKLLYKSLLLDILEAVYTSKGIPVADLDITIISGDSAEELCEVIRLLSPYVKYLTVAAAGKEEIEKALKEIYEDTGLSCMVTQDYGSGFKNADLVISLANLNEPVRRVKCRAKSVLINYDERVTTGLANEISVINGVEVRLPVKLVQKMSAETFEFFSQSVLAEVLLLHRLEMQEAFPAGRFERQAAKALSDEFKKCGYSIAGFEGRHNRIGLQDFRLR